MTFSNVIRNYLRPSNIFTALDQIDAEEVSYSLARPQAMRRVFVVLAFVAVSLLVIHYLKFSSVFVAFLRFLSQGQNAASPNLLQSLANTQFFELMSYGWWTFWHVIGYVILPCICIKYFIRERIRDMGWCFNETLAHWRGYLLLLSPILCFVVLVSYREDFIQHYPFYDQAGRSWFDFIAWEFLYLTQFVCLEFFFRGFFLQALRPAIGANAVWVMCIPYLMIHFPKLWPEATGAILFGLFLGILALRSRSIWGGVVVHTGVALSMDLMSLVKQGELPEVFWPL